MRGTLVLIHAFPLNARMWERQLELAEGGWRVLAPQLRGFDGGQSDPPATSVDDYAADLFDLLDALHIEQAVIGGVSMAGYVAFAMMRRAPQYFQALVLADTRAEADTPEGREGRLRMIALARARGVAAIADEMVPRLVVEGAERERPELVQAIRELVLANPTSAITGALQALMTRPDSTPVLSTIRCPTLVVVGDRDRITPPEVAEKLSRAIAGSELVTIAGAGHVPNLEQPAAFNAALARFLAHRV